VGVDSFDDDAIGLSDSLRRDRRVRDTEAQGRTGRDGKRKEE
jgi:hypothetical protein